MFVAGVSLLATPSAWAGPPPATETSPPPRTPSAEDRAAGREHFDRGATLYKSGDFKLALLEFERAYDFVPDYRVLYNIGQVCQQLGHYARASQTLNQYLREGGSAIAAERRKAVLADLEAMRLRTGHLLVTSTTDGAEVLVDDVVVARTPARGPILVDAGEHTVEVRKPGMIPASKRIALVGQEQLAVTLSPTPPALPSGGPTSPNAALSKPSTDAGPSSPRRPWLWAGWITTGMAAAGAGIAGIYTIGAYKDLEDERKQKDTTRERLDAANSRLKTASLSADVLTGVAVALAIPTLYYTFKPSGTTSGVSVSATATSVSATLTFD
jgi:tetratricopeptide (TPR) repeat protein